MNKKNLLTVALAILVAVLSFTMAHLIKKVDTLENTLSTTQEDLATLQEQHLAYCEKTNRTICEIVKSMNYKNEDINQHLEALDDMVINHISEEYQGNLQTDVAFQETEYADDQYLYDVPGYSASEFCGDGLAHVLAQYNVHEIAYALTEIGVFEAYCHEHNFTVEILPYYCG